MNVMVPFAVASALFVLAALVAEAAPSVRLLALDGRGESPAQLPAVFGNSVQGFDVEIVGVNASGASLHATAFQVAGGLAMPLGPDLDLQDGFSSSDASPQKVHIALKIPAISRQAKIVYRLSIVSRTSASNPIGEITVDVFPASLTTDLGRVKVNVANWARRLYKQEWN